MIRVLILGLFVLLSLKGWSQNFELLETADTYSTSISQTLRIPIKIRNNGDKANFFVIRLTSEDLRGSQKGYFCLEGQCLEPGIIEFSKKIEAGATLTGLYFSLETGLVTGQNFIRFEVFVKGMGQQVIEQPITINIDEKQSKGVVFRSKDIIVHEVYPNPVSSSATIDYELLNEQIKAKIIIHNILGSSVGEQELPFLESKAKISAEDLTPGVYFYTIYLDNEGVITRKLIVRR